MKKLFKRAPIGIFVSFVLIAVTCGFICFHYATSGVGADKISTEAGLWALRLRIAELVLLSIGTASVLLLIEQINQTSRWNSRLSYHQFFQEIPSHEKLSSLASMAEKLKIDVHERSTPIDSETARTLLTNGEYKRTVVAYMNDFEEFAMAVLSGLVETEYAEKLEGLRVRRAWTVFLPWVMLLRGETVSQLAYCELEKLVLSWECRKPQLIASKAITPT